jgi:hypothetical protein
MTDPSAIMRLALPFCACWSVFAARSAWSLRNVASGDPMPEFRLTTAGGNELSRDAAAGRPLILVFVRPGQTHSLEALAQLAEVRVRIDETVRLWVAATREQEVDGWAARVADVGAGDLPTAVDVGRELYGALGVIVTPTTVVIDAAGTVRGVIPHVPPRYAERLIADTRLARGDISVEEHKRLVTDTKAPGRPADALERRRYALVRSLLDRNKLTAAARVLAEFAAGDEDAPAIRGLAARLHCLKGNWDAVSGTLNGLDAASCNDADALEGLMLAALVEARKEDAIAIAARGAEHTADAQQRSRFHYVRGCLLGQHSDDTGAVSALRESLATVHGLQIEKLLAALRDRRAERSSKQEQLEEEARDHQ